jgi:hypothetical protein
MAKTLRAALGAKGLKITISQSLELIAKLFGMADWNTLAAAIRQEALTPPENASPRRFRQPDGLQLFSRERELTLHRAMAFADQRHHEYTTLEHLLLALIDDATAAAVMNACKVDLGALKESLTSHIDNELKTLVTDDGRDAAPTPTLQRVVQRAAVHAQSQGRDAVTTADLLVAMFDETESHAVWLLGGQKMTQQDAAKVILLGKGSGDAVAGRRRHGGSPVTPEPDEVGKRSVEQGIVRQSFSHGRTKPVVVEKVKRRTARTGGKTGKNTK